MRTRSRSGGLVIAFGAGLLLSCICGTKALIVILAIAVVSLGLNCLKC